MPILFVRISIYVHVLCVRGSRLCVECADGVKPLLTSSRDNIEISSGHVLATCVYYIYEPRHVISNNVAF